MKNKVLRLAIVAVLVVAMVLTMAACVDPVPQVSPTPTPGGTTSPTPGVTTSPSKTPVVPGGNDDTALAKATYGIELIKNDFVYGNVLKDPTKPWALSNSLSTVELKFDAKLLQNYKTTATYGTEKLPFEIVITIEYEGEAAVTKADLLVAADGTFKYGKVQFGLADEDPLSDVKHYILTFNDKAPVGSYTINAKITAEDLGFYFGRFGAIKEEKVTYEVVTIVNVSKADLTIKTPSYVAPVRAKTDKAEVPVVPDFIHTTPRVNVAVGTATPDEKFAEAMLAAFGDKYEYKYQATAMMDVTEVGSYDFKPYAFSKTNSANPKEENAEVLEDLVSINYNVTFENGKQYFISQYDWNLVRDTATSIIELDPLVGAETLKLARTRYDALTLEQKVFFKSGNIIANTATPAVPATVWSQAKVSIGQFNGTGSTGDNKIELVSIGTGAALLKTLELAEKDAIKEALFAAFNKVVRESKFAIYSDPTFNIENATHVAAFTAVKTYFDALAKDEQEIIKVARAVQGTDPTAPTAAEILTNTNYALYNKAMEQFAGKALNDTQAAIAAAVAAYNRAVQNPATNAIIFTDALAIADAAPVKVGDNKYNGVVFYLNNFEVKAATAQAKTAFDKLDKAVQAGLNALALVKDADAAEAKKNFDIDALTYGKTLAALVTMNEVVGYMEQVVNHTKIEDLAHTDANSPAYSSLRMIVYGNGANDGYIIDTNIGKADYADRSTFSAVADIMNAYSTDSASLDPVVAEYKAMIDYILAAEAYKATVVAAFNAAIAEEFTIANGKTETEIAVATAAKNPVKVGLEKAITSEGRSGKGTYRVYAKKDEASAGGNEVIITKNNAQTILNKTNETYAEASAQFEDMFNVDAAIGAFNLYFNLTPLDANTPTAGKMIAFVIVTNP